MNAPRISPQSHSLPTWGIALNRLNDPSGASQWMGELFLEPRHVTYQRAADGGLRTLPYIAIHGAKFMESCGELASKFRGDTVECIIETVHSGKITDSIRGRAVPRTDLVAFVSSHLEKLDPSQAYIVVCEQHIDHWYGAVQVDGFHGLAEFGRGGGPPITRGTTLPDASFTLNPCGRFELAHVTALAESSIPLFMGVLRGLPRASHRDLFPGYYEVTCCTLPGSPRIVSCFTDYRTSKPFLRAE